MCAGTYMPRDVGAVLLARFPIKCVYRAVVGFLSLSLITVCLPLGLPGPEGLARAAVLQCLARRPPAPAVVVQAETLCPACQPLSAVGGCPPEN
jgi:hypothetical protein